MCLGACDGVTVAGIVRGVTDTGAFELVEQPVEVTNVVDVARAEPNRLKLGSQGVKRPSLYTKVRDGGGS